MALAQQWIGVIGLMADFYGVLLLTREFPLIFGRGFRGFVSLVGKRHLKVATKIRHRYEVVAARKAKSHAVWHWLYDLAIAALRSQSRTESRHMQRSAKKIDVEKLALVDANGILDPVTVKAFTDNLHDYVDDLVENGETRDHSAKGLMWVLIGLGMQILGGIPLPL